MQTRVWLKNDIISDEIWMRFWSFWWNPEKEPQELELSGFRMPLRDRNVWIIVRINF